MQTAV